MKRVTHVGKFLIAAALILSSMSVNAYEPGSFIFRAGPANVDPDSSSGQIILGGTALPGTSVSVDSNTQLGLTMSYFWRDNFALGLLAATPFEHDISETGVGISDVGSTKHLPPTLTVQYFPAGSDSNLQPYVGAGINYTTFFSEKTSGALNAALGDSSMSLDDSFGLALEAGIDIAINQKWSFNAAVWYLDIDTDAAIETGAGRIEVDVEIDPTVFMAGLAYRF